MSAKKNKNQKTPAVGKPAAGSNNKREKKEPIKQKNAQTKSKDSRELNKNKKEKSQRASAQKREPSSFKESFEKFKKKYNVGKIIAAVVVTVSVITGVLILSLTLFSNMLKVPDSVKNAEFKGRLEPDSVAYKADISEQQQKKLAKAISTKGSNKFRFFVNEEIVINECSDPALIEFGSVASNKCILVATLLDENDNIVYRSLGVEPGEEIKSIKLFEELPYGTHKLTLAVNGYDAESYEKLGTKTAELKIKIGVD